MPPTVTVSTPVFAQSGNDLVITFNVKTDGVNFADFPLGTVSTAYQFNGTLRNALNTANEAGITPDPATPVTVAGGTGGNYTITVAGGWTAYAATPSRYLFRLERPASGDLPRIRAIVMGNYTEAPEAGGIPLVGTAGCSGCHSTMGNGFHYGYPTSGQNCTVCHDATNTTYPRLVNIGHGIHNSELMPGGSYTLENTTASRSWTYAVSYPTYMSNCSVCHTKDSGALAKANAMPVTADNCFSCHGSLESWEFAPPSFSHEGVTGDCESCHFPGNTLGAPTTVTEMHNGIETERVGLIWDGEDRSVTDGEDFTWQITGITDSVADGTLAITWTSTYKGNSVDPCNSTIAANAPGYFNVPQPDGALSMLRTYQQGNDFILGQSVSAPGQANAVNVTTANTVCAGNVATTTIPRDDMPSGMVGIVALQGKPQILLPADFNDPKYSPEYEFAYEYVRVPTPTYEFVVGSGLPPTTMRREIVGNDQCLTCHVGSLYQHGNNRVDNTKMCVMCHNSASSDQNNRVAMGVTAADAYDGQVGQTYELKTMLHRIHTAGESTAPFVIYRTRGIYAWAESASDIPNWLPAVPCTPAQPGKSLVYGADPALAISCQPHLFYEPTYPRQFNDCAACHVPGSVDDVPVQSEAVATTLDTGPAPYGPGPSAQLNDTLQGASAAACTSCHNTTEVRGHAYQNGWVPQVFPEGRQTILDTP